MILCEENLAEFGFEFDLSLAQKIAETLTNKDIELVVLNENAMRALNKAQRGFDKPTDVLSFPLNNPLAEFENSPLGENSSNKCEKAEFSQNLAKNPQFFPLGSIVINANAVKIEAKSRGHSEEAEFSLLFLHAILHLLGYDHEKDEGQMREKERQIIEKFKLPKSLIVRNEA